MQKNQTKVAVITGAARRIGAEIARHLHQTGMNIVIHYYQSEVEALALCASLNHIRPASAVTVCADLSDIARLPDVMAQAIAAWGRLDVLVNNASRFYPTAFGQVNEAAWDDLMGSNVKAPFFLAQAAAPALRLTQGCIVNIADIHGERPMRDYSAYCISKAAIRMMTLSLAKELGPEVRVNAVSPGAMAWPEGENVLSDAVKAKIIDRVTLKRVGDPAEIAKAVVYLVHSAHYMTGQIMAVDGGRSLMI